MGEVKHTPTPGPWWVAGKATIRYGDPNSIDTGWVASVHWRNREANARVIAAAPTMFDYIAARASSGDTEAAMIIETIHVNS